MSGIGCSSKTPDYFLGASHGFNSVHGRMPSVLTGANLANRDLIYLGVSGDGDSASIGFGHRPQHPPRREHDLHRREQRRVRADQGQFSATSDKGSKAKKGVVNTDEAIDLIGIALQLGATYVGRSFSGDKDQLVPLIKGALRHNGPAFIDCISPCVAFNNHEGSTKSYDFVREHNEAMNFLDVILGREAITTEYAPGEVRDVVQHDGSVLRLRKLHDEYDPTDRVGAMHHLHERKAAGEIVTGLLYIDPDPQDLHENLATVATPLNRLDDAALVPGRKALEKLNASLR
ncbi:2-oxoacid:ferredoxin oxidoreductase subunit beta [Siccirubricoccus deserti]